MPVGEERRVDREEVEEEGSMMPRTTPEFVECKSKVTGLGQSSGRGVRI